MFTFCVAKIFLRPKIIWDKFTSVSTRYLCYLLFTKVIATFIHYHYHYHCFFKPLLFDFLISYFPFHTITFSYQIGFFTFWTLFLILTIFEIKQTICTICKDLTFSWERKKCDNGRKQTSNPSISNRGLNSWFSLSSYYEHLFICFLCYLFNCLTIEATNLCYANIIVRNEGALVLPSRELKFYYEWVFFHIDGKTEALMALL